MNSQAAAIEQQGFTLIEVLIAIAIFAILSVLAYGGLEQVMKNRSRTDEALQRLGQIQLTMIKMQRDFEQILPLDARDALGVRIPALSTGQGSDLLIQFTRHGWRNPARLTRSHLQRVAYRLDEDALFRISWPYVDGALDLQATEIELIDNVEDATIRIMDDKKKWSTIWPDPASAVSGTNTTPPIATAIEITLKLYDWGDIVRLYRIVE